MAAAMTALKAAATIRINRGTGLSLASDNSGKAGATRQYLIWAAAILVTAALFLALFPLAEKIDSYGARQGAAIYQAHCASCHGADLAGRPGWQSAAAASRSNPQDWPAPPLDEAGHAWMHDDSELFLYTKLSAAGSPMPAFGNVLSDNEIWQVFAYVKSHWPENVRAFQRAGDPYADLPADLPADWTYPPSCEPGDAPGGFSLSLPLQGEGRVGARK
jgi:mono/diheme cytochrome c family protein